MPAPGNARTLTTVVSAYTFAWLAVYVPLETSVTVSIAGPGGLLYSAYIMNLMGMALMLWSAVAARRAQPTAPGLLAAGWAWTAATFWRATSDRFWWVSQGHALFAGPIELWLGPALTILALLGLLGSLILVLNSPKSGG